MHFLARHDVTFFLILFPDIYIKSLSASTIKHLCSNEKSL